MAESNAPRIQEGTLDIDVAAAAIRSLSTASMKERRFRDALAFLKELGCTLEPPVVREVLEASERYYDNNPPDLYGL